MRRSSITVVVTVLTAFAAATTGCLDRVVPKEGEITLTIDPSVVDKESYATITVLALDELGAPVMDGTQVFLTTDMGVLLPYGEEPDPTSFEDQHKVNVGTRRGVALVTFYSGSAYGTATITVKSGDHTLEGYVVVGRTPDQILLSVQGQSGGSGSLLPPEGGSVIVTAYVRDASDNPIVDEDVIFSSTAGVLESGGGRLRTDVDGTVQDVLTTSLTAEVTAMLPGSATMPGLMSPSVTVTVPGPTLYMLDPAFGLPGGNEQIVVAGVNFAYGARVLFDGIPASYWDGEIDPADWDQGRIVVRTPPSRYGEQTVVDVVVQNPNNTYDTLPNGFRYEIPVEDPGGTP